MRKCITFIILTLTACSLMTSCDKQAKKAEAWDFVITAKEAELKGDQLTLITNSEHLFAFTDRPNRKFATISMEEWTKAWNKGSDSFEKDPPNAVLVGTNSADEKEVLVEIQLMSAPVKVDGGYRFAVKMMTPLDGTQPDGYYWTILYIDDAYM
jgi:hypothetical protein